MRVIPVLDLLGGRAVHARGGVRSEYGPVRSVLYQGDDPLGLALACCEAVGGVEIYLADLDAIGGGPADLGFLRRAADAGLRVWVDAGVREPSRVAQLFDAGAGTVIAATETVPGASALEAITRGSTPGSIAFGLDLRHGRPILAAEGAWPAADAEGLVETAWRLEVRRVVTIDLGRVGTGTGFGGADLLSALGRWPGLEIAAGGGVAGPADLGALEQLGVSAALVGSALHDGRLPGSGRDPQTRG
jgi:phosphoribosylformimino-5-aminoimidazole carboxamide ribotide isomerase